MYKRFSALLFTTLTSIGLTTWDWHLNAAFYYSHQAAQESRLRSLSYGLAESKYYQLNPSSEKEGKLLEYLIQKELAHQQTSSILRELIFKVEINPFSQSQKPYLNVQFYYEF